MTNCIFIKCLIIKLKRIEQKLNWEFKKTVKRAFLILNFSWFLVENRVLPRQVLRDLFYPYSRHIAKISNVPRIRYNSDQELLQEFSWIRNWSFLLPKILFSNKFSQIGSIAIKKQQQLGGYYCFRFNILQVIKYLIFLY